MPVEVPVTTIAHAIQLAVAPVFLLAGVGGILNVMTNRLARIIDRSRVLDGRLPTAVDDNRADLIDEMGILARRARLIHRAIGLCTACALFVCAVVAVVFLGSFISVSMAVAISLLFVIAMLCLIVALLLFLREIQLAMSAMLLRY